MIFDRKRSQGQVSEVGRLDEAEAGVPISDGQSVHGQPDGESGRVQEGPAGPNAKVPGADDAHPEYLADHERESAPTSD